MTGIDSLQFTEISPVLSGFKFSFSLINLSLDSTVILSTSLGTSIINSGTSGVVIPPTYVYNGIVYISSVIPPQIIINTTSIRPDVKYLSNNFENGLFQTSLSYKIGDTFMIPGSSVLVQNTSSNYVYTETDVFNNIMVRNPSGPSIDGLDNLLTQSIFTIQNMSAFSITISGSNSSGIWVYNPNPITIGSNSSCDIQLYNEVGINYATSLGVKGI